MNAGQRKLDYGPKPNKSKFANQSIQRLLLLIEDVLKGLYSISQRFLYLVGDSTLCLLKPNYCLKILERYQANTPKSHILIALLGYLPLI